MSVSGFLDTNVLVYAISSATEDAAKREAAIGLIRVCDFGLSSQVLQEFYVTATSKIRVPLEPEQALLFLEELRVFPTVLTDYALILSAIELAIRYKVSYWDGAILAAAAVLEAPVLYSEDLNHGQRYGSVRVVNPFFSSARVG